MRWMIVVMLLAGAAQAEGERAGAFAYYVLALSWSPSWCRLEGDARGADQCDARHDHSFVMHGLWPQNEAGWPSFCRTGVRDPSRGQTAAMADIMGSAGLAWYQWKKHGRCAGLTSEAYFEAARAAYGAVTIPPVLRHLSRDVKLPATVVEQAFLQSNPGMGADMITITCKAGLINEARICLTKDLALRNCGMDVRQDCALDDALMEAVR